MKSTTLSDLDRGLIEIISTNCRRQIWFVVLTIIYSEVSASVKAILKIVYLVQQHKQLVSRSTLREPKEIVRHWATIDLHEKTSWRRRDIYRRRHTFWLPGKQLVNNHCCVSSLLPVPLSPSGEVQPSFLIGVNMFTQRGIAIIVRNILIGVLGMVPALILIRRTNFTMIRFETVQKNTNSAIFNLNFQNHNDRYLLDAKFLIHSNEVT